VTARRALTLALVVLALCAAPAALGQTETREPSIAELWGEYPLDQSTDGPERLQARERDGSKAGPPPRDPSPGGPVAMAILYAMLGLLAFTVLFAFRRFAIVPLRRLSGRHTNSPSP
jgi:hypothetical protein